MGHRYSQDEADGDADASGHGGRTVRTNGNVSHRRIVPAVDHRLDRPAIGVRWPTAPPKVSLVRHRSATIGRSGLLPQLQNSPRFLGARIPVGIVVALVVLAASGLPVFAADGPRTVAVIEDEIDAAELKLERLASQKQRAEATTVELKGERQALQVRAGQLDGEAEEYLQQLRLARRDARLATVEAYVSGNRVTVAPDIANATDALWQETMLTDRADAGVEAAIRYQELRTQTAEEVVRLAENTDQVEVRIRQAATDTDRAVRSMTATRERISSLREEIKILEIVAQFGTSRGDAGPGAWAALRNCESHGNYAVNTGNGFYGAYQFDLQTWRSTGGSGLPSAAPPWEQDARAKALYQQRGSQPWPICGRFLN
jgi:hypothetical protein